MNDERESGGGDFNHGKHGMHGSLGSVGGAWGESLERGGLRAESGLGSGE